MAQSSNRMRDLGRRQLDRRLQQIRSMMSVLRPPQNGWISTVRTALGMTQADLAQRMGVTRQAVSHLEQREVDGAVTLKALREAAQAMGGELVYAIVPQRSISETLEQRAYQVALQMTRAVRHTMRLEDQETEGDLDERTREIARRLLDSPNRLWAVPDAE
jgi:predicted DNA-binding mobile mystery protein A